jgi:hypothetical protein
MTRRASLKRGLIGLWCAAAVGCAKLADEPAPEAAAAARPSAAEVVAAPPALPVLPPEAPPADAAPASFDRPPAVGGVPEAPATATAAAAPQAPAPAAAEPAAAVVTPGLPAVAPAPRAGRAPEGAPDLGASPFAALPPGDTLDFTSLVTRLRTTKAINLRTKLKVKNESDDLLDMFRAYHTRRGTATLAELRRSYDSLFAKLSSLLEDADAPLARDIDRSRGAIWELLADPRSFDAAGTPASGSSSPRA